MSDEIQTVPAKNIIFRTKSPDEWFGLDYNMNIYRGCSHGCIYCDSRSDCYRVVDFDTVKVKEDALRIIRDDLRRKVKTGVIGTGAMSDPYNPLEKDLKLTRNSLELINAYNFGVCPITKSDLITRDADILQDIKKHSPTMVIFTITTADDELCKMLEPNVSVTSNRFKVMRILSDYGIFCGTVMVPLLPFINDTEENVSSIVQMTKEAGGKFVSSYMGMTLRQGNREYYYKQLDNMFPGIKEQYIKRFGTRYSCSSPNAKMLWNVFTTQCEKLGLIYKMKSIIRQYKMGYESNQLKFL